MSHTATLRSPYISLAQVNPDLAAEWDHDRNGSLTPESVSPSSGRDAWWVCPNGHLPYLARISNRNAGHGCLRCGWERSREAKFIPVPGQSLADLFPEVAAQWDHDANDGLTPSDVRPHSSVTVRWVCPRGHGGYRTAIFYRTKRTPTGCPACGIQTRAAKRSLPAPGRSLAELHPDLAAHWDAAANAPRTPADVAAQSKLVFSWLCPEGHPPFDMRVRDFTGTGRCPGCRAAA